MKLTNTELDKFLDDAKRATQGEWEYNNSYTIDARINEFKTKHVTLVNSSTSDAKHIFNFQPANAIKLIEELKFARTTLRKVRDCIPEDIIEITNGDREVILACRELGI